jgi:hypothetical protein
MFDLNKFLKENKLTRNSVLLEGDNAPAFTPKEMKFFDPKQVKWGFTPNTELAIVYKGYTYELGVDNREITEPAENIGYVDTSTDKLPGVNFIFSVDFGYDKEIYDITDLDEIEVEPVWELDPDSDEIPDEEEINFDDDLNEIAIATAFQFTPEQFNLLKKYGAKQSTSGRELYFPPSLYNELQLDARKSKFKQDFNSTVNLGDQYIASQILTAIKKSLSSGNTVKIKDQTYYVLKGHLTKNNNFNFPNPFRNKQIKEMKGPELVNTIKMIGSTLSKIEQLMDFGMDQSPETVKGLNNVLDVLIDIQSNLESDRRAYMGPSSDYQLENIIKRK